MILNSNIKDGILWGLSCESKLLAEQVDLMGSLEKKTGCSFFSYFRDRKEANILLEEIYNWIVQNYSTIAKQYTPKAAPYHELAMLEQNISISEIQEHLSRTLQRTFIEQIFGKDKIIRAVNRMLKSKLQDEFYADGSRTSKRDFSFLLEDD